MSKTVTELEQELKVAQELLFLVLDHIDRPVVLDVNEARNASQRDRIIDLQLDEEAQTWTLQVVSLEQ